MRTETAYRDHRHLVDENQSRARVHVKAPCPRFEQKKVLDTNDEIAVTLETEKWLAVHKNRDKIIAKLERRDLKGVDAPETTWTGSGMRRATASRSCRHRSRLSPRAATRQRAAPESVAPGRSRSARYDGLPGRAAACYGLQFRAPRPPSPPRPRRCTPLPTATTAGAIEATKVCRRGSKRERCRQTFLGHDRGLLSGLLHSTSGSRASPPT